MQGTGTGMIYEKTRDALTLLDQADLSNLPAHADTWERVIRKVRGGMMPPPGVPHPDQASRDGLIAWLAAPLDRATGAVALPRP